uniref:Uncharacterized protein n=1 Tax=Sphaeramia orbicularis TaxID=375764 RepID=A0A673A6L9_9TELE
MYNHRIKLYGYTKDLIKTTTEMPSLLCLMSATLSGTRATMPSRDFVRQIWQPRRDLIEKSTREKRFKSKDRRNNDIYSFTFSCVKALIQNTHCGQKYWDMSWSCSC